MPRTIKALFLLSLLLIISCQGGAAALPGDARPQHYHLTVLHTNDFHGENYGALEREATLIKKIKAEEKHVLYLEAGDVFTRGAYQYKFHGALEFAVLNALGCSALTLGNNEFKDADDPGRAQQTLKERIAQADFPVLCANITSAKDGTYIEKVRPYVVLPVAGVKIGILGLSAYRISDYGQLRGYRVSDPVETAGKIVPPLKAEADIVLALTHLGIEDDVRLANSGSGIMAIIGGDSHTVLEEPQVVNGIPIVQAGEYGMYLGRLDLFFELKNGAYILKSFTGKLIPVTDDLPVDPDIKALIDSYLRQALKEAA